MGLPQGRTNNPAGRRPGALNKIHKDLKLNLSEFLNTRFSEFEAGFDALDPKDKVNAYISLIPFVVPKMVASSTVEVDIEAQKKTVHDLFPEELNEIQ